MPGERGQKGFIGGGERFGQIRAGHSSARPNKKRDLGDREWGGKKHSFFKIQYDTIIGGGCHLNFWYIQGKGDLSGGHLDIKIVYLGFCL